jgi:hypothetical protein
MTPGFTFPVGSRSHGSTRKDSYSIFAYNVDYAGCLGVLFYSVKAARKEKLSKMDLSFWHKVLED